MTALDTIKNFYLPNVVVVINPKGVRSLLERAGIPYVARLDKLMAGLAEPRVANMTLPVTEFAFKHGDRLVTVRYARLADPSGKTMPQLRIFATSVDAACAEKPDEYLNQFLGQLRQAIGETGSFAEANLQELLGPGVKWDQKG